MSSDSSSIASAINWVASLLTGTLATTVAVIAVAVLGVAAMRGQIQLRDYGRVVLGCFIIFSARTIALGLAGLAADGPRPSFDTAIAAPPPTKPMSGYDPYAGASLQ